MVESALAQQGFPVDTMKDCGFRLRGLGQFRVYGLVSLRFRVYGFVGFRV